jgi:D-3-phosphoglycerate dehydrogenase
MHPRVYGSHYIGASTKQAENEIGEESVRITQVFAVSGSVENCVNMDTTETKNSLVLKAKTSTPLGDIFNTATAAGWIIGKYEYFLLEGGEVATVKIEGSI